MTGLSLEGTSGAQRQFDRIEGPRDRSATVALVRSPAKVHGDEINTYQARLTEVGIENVADKFPGDPSWAPLGSIAPSGQQIAIARCRFKSFRHYPTER
jgi:hypothetical protein